VLLRFDGIAKSVDAPLKKFTTLRSISICCRCAAAAPMLSYKCAATATIIIIIVIVRFICRNQIVTRGISLDAISTRRTTTITTYVTARARRARFRHSLNLFLFESVNILDCSLSHWPTKNNFLKNTKLN
jgi:multisubunit Na+/H+ antiporter MnhF subunit